MQILFSQKKEQKKEQSFGYFLSINKTEKSQQTFLSKNTVWVPFKHKSNKKKVNKLFGKEALFLFEKQAFSGLATEKGQLSARSGF